MYQLFDRLDNKLENEFSPNNSVSGYWEGGGYFATILEDGFPRGVWQEVEPYIETRPEILNTPIISQIKELELKQLRPIREQILNPTEEGLARINSIDAQIAELRTRLI